MTVRVHPTAEIEDGALVGDGVTVWHYAHIRAGATVGARTTVGKGVFVDHSVTVGDDCKVQNYAQLFHGVSVEDGVFIGPGAILANDLAPRAITPRGSMKTAADWTVLPTTIRHGASIGAGAIVLPGLEIGEWAMVAAGAVVTRSVPAHRLVIGTPAVITGTVCRCGHRATSCEECEWTDT